MHPQTIPVQIVTNLDEFRFEAESAASKAKAILADHVVSADEMPVLQDALTTIFLCWEMTGRETNRLDRWGKRVCYHQRMALYDEGEGQEKSLAGDVQGSGERAA